MIWILIFFTFFSKDLDPNSVFLDSINLDNEYFDCCDLETVIHVRLMGWYNKYKQHKTSKKVRWSITACSVAF